MPIELLLELRSDTTFSRGDGTAGEVDAEVVHDEFGCPFVPGRTVKGLLRDAWLQMSPAFPADARHAGEVLGESGDLIPGGAGRLRIDDARLPASVRGWLVHAVTRRSHPVEPGAVLRALTAVRKQTARDRRTGGPRENTLRSLRTVLRETGFRSTLTPSEFSSDHWRVLAWMCLNVRHAGAGRNRGLGHVRLALMDGASDVTRRLSHLG